MRKQRVTDNVLVQDFLWFLEDTYKGAQWPHKVDDILHGAGNWNGSVAGSPTVLNSNTIKHILMVCPMIHRDSIKEALQQHMHTTPAESYITLYLAACHAASVLLNLLILGDDMWMKAYKEWREEQDAVAECDGLPVPDYQWTPGESHQGFYDSLGDSPLTDEERRKEFVGFKRVKGCDAEWCQKVLDGMEERRGSC